MSKDKTTTDDPTESAKMVDIDASWDGKGSLDEHRQKELAKVKQPGFGDAGKAKANG